MTENSQQTDVNVFQFPVGTNLSTFDPKRFNVNDKFRYFECVATNERYYYGDPPTSFGRLTARELKFAAEAAVTELQKNHAKDPFAQVSKRHSILRNDHPNFAGLHNVNVVVLFQVYLGRGKPKADDVNEYRRIHLRAPGSTKTAWRWAKFQARTIIGSVDYSIDKDSELLSSLATYVATYKSSIDPATFSELCIGLVPIKINCFEFDLPGLVRQSGDFLQRQNADLCRKAINSLLAHETETIPTEATKAFAVLHDHKYYDHQKKKPKQITGLEYSTGTARKLWYTPQSTPPLAMSQQSCFKLFYPCTSIADLFKAYCGYQQNYYDLADALRGVKVQIKTTAGFEDRYVHSLDVLPEQAATGAKHSAWRMKTRSQVQFPEIPCINVDSSQRPELVLPEMCFIHPMQSAASAGTLDLQWKLEEFRKKEIAISRPQPTSDTTEPTNVEQSKVFCTAYEKVTTESGIQKFKASFPNGGPNVIFVEAGVNDRFPGSWTAVRQKILDNATYDEAVSSNLETSLPTLLLLFEPDKNVDGKDTLLVVVVQANEHHKKIYELVKTLCDSDLVDVQTVFVNMATLEHKTRKSLAEGPVKVANEVSRRIRIRNPPTVESEATKDLAVAVHVTRLTPDQLAVDESGELTQAGEIYLVVSASRQRNHAGGYRTERAIYSASQMQEFDMGEHVLTHLSTWENGSESKNKHFLTVIRSGDVPLQEKAEAHHHNAFAAAPTSSAYPCRKLPTFEKDHHGTFFREPEMPASSSLLQDVEGHSDWKKSDSAPNNDESAQPSKAKVINMEIDSIRENVSSVVKPQSFYLRYVLQEEDGAFELANCDAEESRPSNDSSDGKDKKQINICFLQAGKGYDKDTVSVQAHRKLSPGGFAKALSLTLLGQNFVTEDAIADPDSEDDDVTTEVVSGGETENDSNGMSPSDQLDGSPEKPKKPWRERVSKTTQKKRRQAHKKSKQSRMTGPPPEKTAEPLKKTIEDEEKRSPVSPLMDPRAGDEASAAIVTPEHEVEEKIEDLVLAEMKEIAMLFHDENLELFNTRLPIPTYLAQRASKRALMHLRNPAQITDAGQSPQLPKIASDVAQSLYYL